jgi:hypothetical protein
MTAQNEAAGAFDINRDTQDAGDPIAPLRLIKARVIDGVHQLPPGLIHKGGGAGDINLLRMRRAADKASKAGKHVASGEQEIRHYRASSQSSAKPMSTHGASVARRMPEMDSESAKPAMLRVKN